MYYDRQQKKFQEEYKNMLKLIGGLSRLFSTAKEPFLYYRAHENIFAKYFPVENNARSDDSADAYDTGLKIGIGLKTWVGGDNQKVAEFGKLRPKYKHLKGLDLIRQIAIYRNIRIRTTKNVHGLLDMVYHIVKRIPGAMVIYEAAFEEIDIDKIELISGRGSDNSIYFTDGKHTYHFSLSKNTLYMTFEDMQLLDQFEVEIFEDPYDLLLKANLEEFSFDQKERREPVIHKEQLCLRLYSENREGIKFVPQKSGLNQWNASGRLRNPNELYIPYPAVDRDRGKFFPDRDQQFDLKLPDGEWIPAKVCQDDGKAIMSNPNRLLGKWLLRDVFELPEGTVVTYNHLEEFNIDSVIFTKLDNQKYEIDFCPLGTYEDFYNKKDRS